MAWYVIDIPEESMWDGDYHRFCREFQRAFIDSGAPPDLALFAQRDPSSHGRRLYLSPHSHGIIPDLMQTYEARPCISPDASTVTLVYGVPGAQALLSQPDHAAADAPAKRKETSTIYPISRGRSVATGG